MRASWMNGWAAGIPRLEQQVLHGVDTAFLAHLSLLSGELRYGNLFPFWEMVCTITGDSRPFQLTSTQ